MRYLATALLIAVSLTSAAFAQDAKSKTPGRINYVQTLDMSSPESTAALFVEASNRGDYVTVYFLLSPEAKRGFMDKVSIFIVNMLFGANVSAGVYDDPHDLVADAAADTALTFDGLMAEAQRLDHLPYRLTGASPGPITAGPDGVVIVPIEGGWPTGLRLETKILSNGQWRIDRIAWDGSVDGERPWGLPPATP